MTMNFDKRHKKFNLMAMRKTCVEYLSSLFHLMGREAC